MTENKSTTSIAIKINLNFLGRQLSNFFWLDILLFLLIAGMFLYYQESNLPEEEYVIDRDFHYNNSVYQMEYVIRTNAEETYVWRLWDYLVLLKYPVIIIGIFQVSVLFFGLFQTRQIRRAMKPLNEMAKRAEELSHMTWDSSKVSSLENAISSIKPDAPGAKISTGDKELQSLEVAINNLLERMRETYRQQNRFVSDASHELRTPIAVIQGYVNMLDRWGKKDESILEESIEALKNESQHMKELVEQLLFLARGDSGRNTLKKEEFVLTDVVREVYEESLMIDEKHIYRFNGMEGVRMYGDVAMLKQSIRIFTDNAAKYSKEGDRITLSVSQQEDEVSYSVQDEGVGMAESEIVHVFERFYRSDSARNSKTGGTGLGLSIAKWIVDAHGGVIEILSKPDMGTRFTVKFSIKKQQKC